MYDVIVVGARCAGSPTAMLLARQGYRVLLLDRAEFPSDTLSTHVIHQPGIAALARWGLLDRVQASGCPPIDRVAYRVADVELIGCSRGIDGQRAAYAPRRYVLDALLVEGAVEAGAELRGGCSVRDVLRDRSGRVTGVEGTWQGRAFSARARLVIGADGMSSTIARRCGAAYTVQDPRRTCAYYTYWRGVTDHLELYEAPGSWVAAVPTNDDSTLVLAYFPQSRFAEIRTDAHRFYLDQIRRTAPALSERLRGRQPTERLRGSGNQQNFFRTATGPGWVLVGDAGHHKDSITARGISDGFAQAGSLAQHVGAALEAGDRDRLDGALRDYAVRRDEDLLEGYRATLSVARLELHEQRLELLRAVGSDAELTAIYFDTFAGIASVPALYTPRLLALL